MKALVLSTNLAANPHNTPRGTPTGIHKQAVAWLDVIQPGPNYGDGSGIVGDFVGDSKHHGGADKAIYAFAREELDYWQEELGRPLPSGYFGENLTTTGITWAETLIGTVFKVGSTRLQVSVPRIPCRTFGHWLEVQGWAKTITARGDLGAYLRVLRPGSIRPGDSLEILSLPNHGVSMGTAFEAKMGSKQAAEQVVGYGVLPDKDLEKLRRILDRA